MCVLGQDNSPDSSLTTELGCGGGKTCRQFSTCTSTDCVAGGGGPCPVHTQYVFTHKSFSLCLRLGPPETDPETKI